MAKYSNIRDEIRAFVEERNWDQFHTPANLAASVSIEAGELLECFQWGANKTESAINELADVLIYCYLLADKLGVDTDEIIARKVELNAQKYPVEKAYGKSGKYDEL